MPIAKPHVAGPHIRVRVYRIRGNGKIAWESGIVSAKNSPRYHEGQSLITAEGEVKERRSIGLRWWKEPVSPIETSSVRKRKRQAPIANGTDGTNARLFLLANRVKSLRPPPPSPPCFSRTLIQAFPSSSSPSLLLVLFSYDT